MTDSVVIKRTWASIEYSPESPRIAESPSGRRERQLDPAVNNLQERSYERSPAKTELVKQVHVKPPDMVVIKQCASTSVVSEQWNGRPALT